MRILFDLQDYLNNMTLGELIDDKVLRPYGDTLPTLLVEQVEDTRVVRVTNRTKNDMGVAVILSSIDNIADGDRLTIVGRLGQSMTLHGASIALFAGGEKNVEIVSHEPYNNLYSLSCLLTGLANKSLYLSLTKTSLPFSNIDFFIDSILISREIVVENQYAFF